jgi:hypothetical protein
MVNPAAAAVVVSMNCRRVVFGFLSMCILFVFVGRGGEMPTS